MNTQQKLKHSPMTPNCWGVKLLFSSVSSCPVMTVDFSLLTENELCLCTVRWKPGETLPLAVCTSVIYNTQQLYLVINPCRKTIIQFVQQYFFMLNLYASHMMKVLNFTTNYSQFENLTYFRLYYISTINLSHMVY